MQTFVILRRSVWKDYSEFEDESALSKQVADEDLAGEVRWIRSYVLDEEDGTLGTVCIFQAEDEDAIMEHAKRADWPADEVIPVANTVLVQDDPYD